VSSGTVATGALFLATNPSPHNALVVLEGYNTGQAVPRTPRLLQSPRGHGEMEHVSNPDMPWNDEFGQHRARHERLAARPTATFGAFFFRLVLQLDVRGDPHDNPRVRPPSSLTTADAWSCPEKSGKDVRRPIPGAEN